MLNKMIRKRISKTQACALLAGLVAAAVVGYSYDFETGFFAYLAVSLAAYSLLTLPKYYLMILEDTKQERESENE